MKTEKKKNEWLVIYKGTKANLIKEMERARQQGKEKRKKNETK